MSAQSNENENGLSVQPESTSPLQETMSADPRERISERRANLDQRLDQIRSEAKLRHTRPSADPRRTAVLHARLEKRRTQLKNEARAAFHGPQGEERSKLAIRRCEPIPIDQIVIDPDFENSRLSCDPESLAHLKESMSVEGLKTPITVIEVPGEEHVFHLRAGFRRVAAASALGWKNIPACILAVHTPEIDEYWAHIIENSNRENLSTYETANLAKKMRDQFGVGPREFGIRAGYSEPYIFKLLRCIEKLPDEILEAWRNKARLPVDHLAEWSALLPEVALARFREYTGKRDQPPSWLSQPRKRKGFHPMLMATKAGLQRMSRLRSAIQNIATSDPQELTVRLHIVDYCLGARRDVPGVYNPRSRRGTRKSRPKIDVYNPGTPDDGDPGQGGSECP